MLICAAYMDEIINQTQCKVCFFLKKFCLQVFTCMSSIGTFELSPVLASVKNDISENCSRIITTDEISTPLGSALSLLVLTVRNSSVVHIWATCGLAEALL